ncbi:hypothetical protein [Streptomyces carpaticus]|uniref:Uncharacterized protein n=1 Tax=Streptomyces carpaticus TaxID=285558 RepID=A0ABV4ZMK3_9ACTN
MPQRDDGRYIQTAVIGNRFSDQAAVLPTGYEDAKAFRDFFEDSSFWCGELLGGCGRQLAVKPFRARVSHFAHFPTADDSLVHCGRTRETEDSADHLFIKRGVGDWLADQGVESRGTVQGENVWDAVHLWLPDTQLQLRFQLCEGSTDHRGDASASGSRTQWIYDMAVRPQDELMETWGYVLRVRCETEDSIRLVLIGTETPDGRIEWADLTDCAIGPDGLVTPTIRRMMEKEHDEAEAPGPVLPPAPAPAAVVGAGRVRLPLRPELIAFVPLKTPDLPLTHWNSGSGEARYVFAAEVRTQGETRPVQGYVSLPRDIPQPQRGAAYALAGLTAQLVLADQDSAGRVRWLIEAKDARRLPSKERRRRFDWPEMPATEPVVTARKARESWRDRQEAKGAAGKGAAARPERVQRRKPDQPQSPPQRQEQVRRLQELIAAGHQARPTASAAGGAALDQALGHAGNWLGRYRKNTPDTQSPSQHIHALQTAIENAHRPCPTPVSEPAGPPRWSSQRAPAPEPDPEPRPARLLPPDRLGEVLAEAARHEATVTWKSLLSEYSDRTAAPEAEALRRRLVETERALSAEAAEATGVPNPRAERPLLCALVTTESGEPPSCFRDILTDLGFERPQTDRGLLLVWRREQERAHAAHATPPRPMLRRLVPVSGRSASVSPEPPPSGP